VENVPIEPIENNKPGGDLNIKGFLIEMRNKHGNIIVDSQPSPRKDKK
jgi:hypothetical protein